MAKKPLIQIDDEIREMNEEEFTNYQKAMAEIQAKEQAKLDAQQKRNAALTKLAALGLEVEDLEALGL